MTDVFRRAGIVAAAALVVAAGAAVQAQMPVSQGQMITKTFTIEAIDYNTRLVTLKGDDGVTEMAVAGPEVKRFDELKAGDRVEFRYHESVVFAIRRPGQPAPPAEGGGTARRTAGLPGGVVSKQLSKSVVVTALDPEVPSLTVRTDDGRTMSFKVEDRKNLEGLKAGDRVDVTFTVALAVGVQPRGK